MRNFDWRFKNSCLFYSSATQLSTQNVVWCSTASVSLISTWNFYVYGIVRSPTFTWFISNHTCLPTMLDSSFTEFEILIFALIWHHVGFDPLSSLVLTSCLPCWRTAWIVFRMSGTTLGPSTLISGDLSHERWVAYKKGFARAPFGSSFWMEHKMTAQSLSSLLGLLGCAVRTGLLIGVWNLLFGESGLKHPYFRLWRANSHLVKASSTPYDRGQTLHGFAWE